MRSEADPDAKGKAENSRPAKQETSHHRTLIGDSDYYELLELGEMRWRATEEDIRRAYRKVSLRCLLSPASNTAQFLPWAVSYGPMAK